MESSLRNLGRFLQSLRARLVDGIRYRLACLLLDSIPVQPQVPRQSSRHLALRQPRIALDHGGRLTFTRNQAPTERLLPRHGNIFGLADSEFFRIEFRRNAAGEVDGFLSHEPTGTYLVERNVGSHVEGEP